LAMSIHPDEREDLERLRENLWQLVDPATVADTPARFAQFVRDSLAEFAVAKSGYVVGDCGWFSDRSVCYLASGRPVLAQATGFSRFLPVGAGLLEFSTIDDAVAGMEAITSDYARHSRAARALADECFDSDRVLTRL